MSAIIKGAPQSLPRATSVASSYLLSLDFDSLSQFARFSLSKKDDIHFRTKRGLSPGWILLSRAGKQTKHITFMCCQSQNDMLTESKRLIRLISKPPAKWKYESSGIILILSLQKLFTKISLPPFFSGMSHPLIILHLYSFFPSRRFR